jgi:hypothetical protein
VRPREDGLTCTSALIADYALKRSKDAQSRRGGQILAESDKHIGLDVNTEKISVAVADQGGGEPRYWVEIESC